MAKEVAEKEEYKKGNQIGQKYKHKMEQQDKELRLLRPRIAKAESELSAANAKLSSTETARQQLEEKVQQLSQTSGEAPAGRVTELEGQLQTAQNELTELRGRLTKIQSDLTASQALVVSLNAYRHERSH
jgi:chromosome segregation ATPase